jgi:hypothetical protein
MEAAKLRADKLLATDPELFEPAQQTTSRVTVNPDQSVSLPIV